jgi:phytoene dehydrogenase-like protein
LDDKSFIPGEMQKKIEDAPVSEGVFTVYLGLNMPNEGLEKRMAASHVNYLDLSSDCDIYDSEDERFFEKASITFYSPSLINPALAPEGKSSLMLQTMVPHRWMQNWGGGDREAYRQLKRKAMEAMIDKAAKIIPELKSVIEYKDAATPLTYEGFTGNTDGATSSFSWNPQKSFYKNTMGLKVDTPVKNLFIGSCWAMQIGGVPGALAAAYQCAHRVK